MRRVLPVILSAAVICVGAAVPASAAVVRVTSLSALQTALSNAGPGDRIELANGSYTANAAIAITRSGTSGAPITVAAATVGGAEIKGSTGFSFAAGLHDVVLQGFALRHGGGLSVPGDAHHLRLTRNSVQLTSAGNWVTVNGNDVEVDRNTFQNRGTEGVFLQVSGPGTTIAQRTRIHRNHFYNHAFTGSNGGESIRLGYSHKQSQSARAVIELNLFEKADGDPEAISVKSSDNVIRHNTIRDSTGYVVLRHGNRNLVDGNVLLGSGVRFHGNDHRVVNNYVQNSGDRAIVFGTGSEADSGPTSTGHDRPDRVTVAFNTLIGTGQVVDNDGGAFLPKDCVLANNIVRGTAQTRLVDIASGSTVRYEGNIVFGATAGIPHGYRDVDPKLVVDAAGLSRLSAGSPAVDTAAGSYPTVTTDFDPHARTGALDVGADEFGGSVARKPLTRADVGPSAP
ncbi:polysaccharide lyase 6 family protein [Umezawaea sp.]|uniref:polysaccharide lyase 6 family protein n=1 Tax=Umezawaea sp. TaxID=1955258 RepID=UPI002ED4E5BC